MISAAFESIKPILRDFEKDIELSQTISEIENKSKLKIQ